MEIKQITLKPTTVKFVEINPCGETIRLATGSTICGMKPVPTKTNIADLSKLIRCGVKISELTFGIGTPTKTPLYSMNVDKVFSEQHLEFLKKINTGYIDVNEEIFAGNKASVPVVTEEELKKDVPNNASTSFAWNEADTVIGILTDTTVANREQVIRAYTDKIMVAIARRIATSEEVANIIGKFRALDIPALNTSITTLAAAMETAIKKDIYNGTVEIPTVEKIEETTEVVEETVAEEVVEETITEEVSEEVVETVEETPAATTEEPVAEETETVENAEEAPKQSNVPSNANKRRNRKH